MRLLLIYSLLPETIEFYEFLNPNEKELEILKNSHNKFINSDKGMEEFCKLLEPPPDSDEERYIKQKKISSDKPIEGPWDLIVNSGFYL